MPAFIDARCKKCGHKIGWYGELKDQPKCPKCGAEPDRAALVADQEKMEQSRRMMRTPHAFEQLPKTANYCKVCGLHQKRGPHI